MAVQAQYFSSFCNTEEVFLQQYRDLYLTTLCNEGVQNIFSGKVFSEPESELTCNNNNNIVAMGGSRKRSREDCHDSSNLEEQMFYHQQYRFPNKFMKAHTENGSHVTSTSGRTFENATYDLSSHIFQQNQEMDSLILLENQKLESRLKEVHKKHSKSLLSVIEQQVSKKMQEKENELAIARRQNAELEEKLRQMSAETQIWFNVAKNNESMVSTLKSSLEQILVQKQGQLNEGFGDSESVVDDAQSSCDEDNNQMKVRRCCKVCQENEVSVLLLPCRHLCVCKNCDTNLLGTCPICNSLKNASLEIFTS
ncbi:RING-type E3 ubiquitin transferase [Ranunculus cassubicifolius]